MKDDTPPYCPACYERAQYPYIIETPAHTYGMHAVVFAPLVFFSAFGATHFAMMVGRWLL